MTTPDVSAAPVGAAVPRRTLGGRLEVSALGYGAMVLVGLYGRTDEDSALRVVRHAVDTGVTFLDTADAYGPDGLAERLVGQAVAGRRNQVQLATKWGIATGPGPHVHRRPDTRWDNEVLVDARPERARAALEASLRRLGVDAVDLWYLHWSDPGVPIEDSVGAMGELVVEGKARHLGVCNTTADELRRAAAAHPLVAVQSEWSLWTRTIEVEVLPTARELGIGVVPWTPLGSGFLTGRVTSLDDGDFRRHHPRFRPVAPAGQP